jgi:diguanylate cyclase (GGDEF)-like protein/PAS domain S-box-containing protein
MMNLRSSTTRAPNRRNNLAIAYALVGCVLAAVLFFGLRDVGMLIDAGARAGGVERATGVRLALADEILGYAESMRPSNGVTSDQIKFALRGALDRLSAESALDNEPLSTLTADQQRELADLIDHAAGLSVQLEGAGTTLLQAERPATRASDAEISAAIDAVAAVENADATTLSNIAGIGREAALGAAGAAQSAGLDLALGILALLAAGVGLVIIPSHRAASRSLEQSIRSQEQNVRIRSEVAKHAAERDKRMSEAQFFALFQSASIGVALGDEAGIIFETNPALQRITGYSNSELCGRSIGSLAQVQIEPPGSGEPLHGDETAAGTGRERRYARRDGSIFWAEERISRAADPDGRNVVCIGLITDVTARKEAEERLRYDATHDTLTGLNNRTAFLREVDRSLRNVAGNPDEPFAILFIDLDRFKFVNDSRGHAFGDAVLTEIGRRLKSWARTSEAIARFGGDEFTALVPRVADAEEARRRSAQLHDALSLPMWFEDLSIRTSASIGICLWSPSVKSAEEMIQAADAAAYRAKAKGRACSVVYDDDMAATDRSRTRIGLDLRTAVENNELRVVYQPIMDLRTQRGIGFEALLRWAHPELGDIPPGVFVPIAEESGLVVPIGEWVMRQAIHQLAVWRRESSLDISMNINVSAQQLVSPDFVDNLTSVLRECAVPANSLTFELTETAMLDSDRLARQALDAIRTAGAHLALDDFGMGYSSLANLVALPIDALKIDRLFVSGTDEGLSSPAIVKAVVALARAMNVDLIAEGVESRKQEAELAAMGCRYAQGYLYSRPLENADACAFVRSMSEQLDQAASS